MSNDEENVDVWQSVPRLTETMQRVNDFHLRREPTRALADFVDLVKQMTALIMREALPPIDNELRILSGLEERTHAIKVNLSLAAVDRLATTLHLSFPSNRRIRAAYDVVNNRYLIAGITEEITKRRSTNIPSTQPETCDDNTAELTSFMHEFDKQINKSILILREPL